MGGQIYLFWAAWLSFRTRYFQRSNVRGPVEINTEDNNFKTQFTILLFTDLESWERGCWLFRWASPWKVWETLCEDQLLELLESFWCTSSLYWDPSTCTFHPQVAADRLRWCLCLWCWRHHTDTLLSTHTHQLLQPCVRRAIWPGNFSDDGNMIFLIYLLYVSEGALSSLRSWWASDRWLVQTLFNSMIRTSTSCIWYNQQESHSKP